MATVITSGYFVSAALGEDVGVPIAGFAATLFADSLESSSPYRSLIVSQIAQAVLLGSLQGHTSAAKKLRLCYMS